MKFNNIYDKVAKEYDTHYTTPECLQENEEISIMLKEIIKDGDTVLDIGCGTGFMLDMHFVEPEDYIGLDPSPEMLEVFKSKYPQHNVFQYGYEELEIPKHDVAVALFSGQYIPDVKKRKLVNQADKYLYIFYKPFHYPSWVYDEQAHDELLKETDYEHLASIFDLKEWHNYLIAYKKL